jgi:hypothetical protein
MAALSITAANVKQGAAAQVQQGVAGATITAGQAVFRDGTTGKYVLSDADGAGLKQVHGIALHGAADGQPLAVQTGGEITIGATLTAGTAYYLGPTPGSIGPLADVESGDDVILIGIAKTTAILIMKIVDPDVTI